MNQFEGKNYSSQTSYEKALSSELAKEKGECVTSISNEISEFFHQYEIQILENTLSNIDMENYEISQKFQDRRIEFRQALESLLLDDKGKDLTQHQQLISFIKQSFNNKINEEQINSAINQWQNIRLTALKISQIFHNYKLDSFIQTPGLLDILAKVIYHYQFHNQYEFYNSIMLEVIQNFQNGESNQQIRDYERFESILENIELIAINYIVNKQNIEAIEELMDFYSPQMKYLLKNKEIINFLIARHFERWLLKISEVETIKLIDEIDVFQAIKDQNKLGIINFLEKDFSGVIHYLKEIYCQRDNCKIKLIKIIQASAIINNFEQEAGNAMSVLSSMESIISSQDFSKINLKNSTMNNIQFISSNFNGSKMNNVSIVSAQFIDCSLQNVNWQNLESQYLNILRENSTIFSSHKSILISMIVREERQLSIYNFGFYNLHTGKYIKILYKQSRKGYGKQRLKLSCLGQILVYNDDGDGKSIFWNIKCQKKIRVNKSDGKQGKNVLSGDCQTMALQNKNHVNLWRIYKKKQNLQIQDQSVYEIKYSNKNQILILKGNEKSFWDCKNGKEIKTIQKEGEKYKFSPDGIHYAIYQYSSGLSLRKIYDETSVQLIQGIDKSCIYSLKFSPDGKILAIEDFKQIQLWTVQDLKILGTFDYGFQQSNKFSPIIKFSPDGQFLAFKNNVEIVLQDFNKGKLFTRIEERFNVIKIQFSLYGKYLMLQSNNYSRLWNFQNQQKCLNLSNNQQPLIPDSVSFSCCTPYLGFIYGCKNYKSKVIKIQMFNDMKLINEMDFNKNSEFTSFTLSPDFKRIAFYNQNNICVQKIEGGQIQDVQKLEVANWQSAISGAKQFKFSPDGEYLIVFMQTVITSQAVWWSLQVWRIDNQILMYETSVNNDGDYNIDSCEFSNDSQSLAIFYYGIKILNIKSKELNEFKFEKYYGPKTLGFSVEGKFLACDNYEIGVNRHDRQFIICIWKINDRQLIQRLRGHNKKINKIIFLNEDIIASASSDFTIRIWNWPLEQQIQVLNYHQCEISHLSISPDRSMMVSQDCEGTVYLWRNIETKNHYDQLKTENTFNEVIAENQSQNQMIKYFYALHSILNNPKFRSVNCSLNGSQISSTEGFNLQNVFQGLEYDINH